nr:hypothetical protein [Methylobacterium sp. Leaf118]
MARTSKGGAGSLARTGVSSAVRRAFNEALHPRGARGQFKDKPGAGNDAPKAPRKPRAAAAKKALVGETALKTSGVSANDTIEVLSKRVRAYQGKATVREFVETHPKGRAYALRKLAADQKKGVIGFKGAASAAGQGPSNTSGAPALQARLSTQAVAQPGQRLALVNVRKLDAEWQKDTDFRIKPAAPGVNGKLDRAKDFLSNLTPDRTFNAPILGVTNDMLGFEDGRHRFAAMRDLGLTYAPVSMDRESYANARKRGLLAPRGASGVKTAEEEADEDAHGAGDGTVAGLPPAHGAAINL